MADLRPVLARLQGVLVKQRFELAESFGFETRNKYSLQDPDGRVLGYAAEPSRGMWDLVMRGTLGHWRTYDIFVYTDDRQQAAIFHHPFTWFFQRIEVKDMDGRVLGALQQTFTFLRKRFVIEGPGGSELMTMEAPIFSMWQFPFFKGGRQVAKIEKKWGGGVIEILTDKDTFRLTFEDPSLTPDERLILLAAALFIDLRYFEKKADT